jgi:type I restriction enzyme S subunit
MNDKYQAYPEYKDSGIEWLGTIPEDWISTQIKYGFQITLGKMLQKSSKNSTDLLKPYLKAQNIQSYGIDLTKIDSMWFSKNERNSLRLKNSDVLVSEGGDVGRSAIWHEELSECYIQNAINRIRPLKENSSKFINYWIIFLKNTDYINVICNKATIAHYTAEKVSFSPLLLPSIIEQIQITNFLDHETTKIDTLINKQQKLIKLLKEKRQAVISHAVTKGLNPFAPMKDSGVEWLGEVPEHWEVGSIRYYSKILNGSTPSKSNLKYWSKKEVPWLSSGAVNQYHITEASDYISYQALSECSVEILPIETLVLGMIGQGKTRGLSAITKIETTINQNLAAVIPTKKLKSEFLHLVFQASYLELRKSARGGNQAALNCELIGNFKVAIPPITEQLAITVEVNSMLNKFDKLLKKSKVTIGYSEERRSALISAAVTGKIDVRHWQAPSKKTDHYV